MTANETEEAGAAADSVEEFAAWMREMHREAKKPSYTAIVRRSRARYPEATVRESTVSDILNGKRLPRWDTVEPIAWALGGDQAVADCFQRWKQAVATRGQAAAPNTVPPADAGRSGEKKDEVDAWRRRIRWWMATTLAVLGLPLALWGITIVLAQQGEGQGDASPTAGPGSTSSSTTIATSAPSGPDTASPTSGRPSPAATSRSRQLKATLPWAEPAETAWTPDGQIGVSITEIGQAVSYFVITPERSCSVTDTQIGESVVIEEEGGHWIRLIITGIGQFGPDLEDLPVTFQITRGTNDAPRSTHSCT